MLYGNEAYYRLLNLQATNQIPEIKQICHLSRICNEIAFVYIALGGWGKEARGEGGGRHRHRRWSVKGSSRGLLRVAVYRGTGSETGSIAGLLDSFGFCFIFLGFVCYLASHACLSISTTNLHSDYSIRMRAQCKFIFLFFFAQKFAFLKKET